MATDASIATITYTNHRGETTRRRIVPVRLWFGPCEWHDGEQWLLDAVDLDRGMRTFAVRQIHYWE